MQEVRGLEEEVGGVPGLVQEPKRSIPKGAKPIIVQSKKDEVEVIYPEQCMFTWTGGLADAYPNCTLASGDKSKIFIYNRVLLNAKGECNYYQPVFSSNDFKST